MTVTESEKTVFLSAIELPAVLALIPFCILSIFLASSCASEKVINTITKSATTIFFSDKIFLICGL